MITKDKVTNIFCVIDEFCKNFDAEMEKSPLKELPSPDGKRHRRRKGQMSESEIMTIIVCYHFGSFANFKHYYLLLLLSGKSF